MLGQKLAAQFFIKLHPEKYCLPLSSLIYIIVLCRQLALRYHPDKATLPAQKAAADALFKLVAQAYSVLSDADRRMAYDASVLRVKYRTRFGSSFSRPSF